MPSRPVLLDTDTLSELSRGNLAVTARARDYLAEFGRLTITAVTVFERQRGYRAAIREGKQFVHQQQAFEALVRSCIVLPLDADAAGVAAEIWAASSRKQRKELGDILIAGIAVSRGIPLVTRNRKDFEGLAKASALELRLLDWASGAKKSV